MRRYICALWHSYAWRVTTQRIGQHQNYRCLICDEKWQVKT